MTRDMAGVTADWGTARDWHTMRSTGYARAAFEAGGDMESARFDAPLISQVGDSDLWQGGCVGGVHLSADFGTVVSLYPWERYVIAEGVERTEVRMLDSHEGVEFAGLRLATDAVLAGLAKGPTLVHCQAGLNRSGLVAAFTLMRQGVAASEAIERLRTSRSPLVLCNQTFVYQLHELEAERRDWSPS